MPPWPTEGRRITLPFSCTAANSFRPQRVSSSVRSTLFTYPFLIDMHATPIARSHRFCAVSVSLVSLLFILIAAHPACTQVFQQDIRLSRDIVQPVLPEEYKIQSAATIGETTLVVWGSTQRVTRDSLSGILFRQIIRDGIPGGTADPLLPMRHAPFGLVQVFSLDDCFLVVWKDRIDGMERMWMTTVDTGGRAAPAAPLWQDAAVAADGIRAIPIDRGYLIAWTDTTRDLILQRRVDSAGTLLGELSTLDSGYIRNVVQTGGYTLIDTRGGPIVLNQEGHREEIGTAALAKFSGNYSIGKDGSILVCSNDTVMRFGAMFDSIPNLRIRIPVPESFTPIEGAGEWYPFDSGRFATVDATGELHLYCLAYGHTWGYTYPEGYIAAGVFEMSLDSVAPIYRYIESQQFHWAGHRTSWSVVSGTASMTRICNDYYAVRFQCSLSVTTNLQTHNEYSEATVGSEMVTNGADNSWFISGPGLPEFKALLPKFCEPIQNTPVRRLVTKSLKSCSSRRIRRPRRTFSFRCESEHARSAPSSHASP